MADASPALSINAKDGLNSLSNNNNRLFEHWDADALTQSTSGGSGKAAKMTP
jgi:hypothetical protein